MMFHKKKFLLILSLFCRTLIFAQLSDYISLQKYRHPEVNNVSSIVKDTNNFIWVSTQDGIFRFDGKNFRKISFENNGSKLFNLTAARTLLVNPVTNQIFAVVANNGLVGLNTNDSQFFFQKIDLVGSIGQKQVLSIAICSGKYVITTINGIYIYTIQFNQKQKAFNAILSAKQENLEPHLFCKISDSFFAVLDYNRYLFIYQIKKNGDLVLAQKEKIDFLPKTVGDFFTLNYKNNNYYLGTNSGLYIFRSLKNEIQQYQHYIPMQPVYSIAYDKTDNCYVAASNGLYKINGQGVLVNLKNNSTSVNEGTLSSVYSMYFDGESLWLGSQIGLASFVDNNNAFYNITNTYSDNRNLNHVYHLGNDKEGKLLISGENGLFAFSKKKEVSTIADTNTYFLNFTGPDGTQIVSGLDKAFFIENKKLLPIEKKYPEFKDFNYLSFNDYEYLNSEKILLSTENEKGVFIWDYKNKKIEKLESYLNLPDAIIQTNCLYKDGDKLFILTDSVFFEYTNGTLRKRQLQDKVDENLYGLIFDMIRVNNNYYFASYGNGVIKTDTSFSIIKIYDLTNGLSNNGVYKMLSVGDTALFISSNNGINILNLRNDVIRILSEEDGLHGNVFEEFSALKQGNKLYFGGKDGVSVIDLSNLSFNHKKNNLHFIDYKIVDRKNETREIDILGIKEITINNNITQTTIEFQNVIFPFKSKNKYQYKISELNKNWIDLGTTNFVTLIGLSPGIYHLQVRAANEEGIWSETKELIVEFLPKWYQTWLFKLLIFLSIAGIIYAFYSYRIRQLKKQHKIRQDIANDLHDDLGSTLNSVKVFTNLAISGVKQEESLQQIKDNLNEATMGLRDMIWVLDDSLDTVDELVTRLKQYAIPVAGASNIEALIKADSEVNSRQLVKEEKRNLFLVCKEAINNSVKYSGATQINVSITASGKKIHIVVTDNGKGFNVDEVKKGYGLKNMQYRAGQIKYRVTLVSSPGDGTQIDIQPL